MSDVNYTIEMALKHAQTTKKVFIADDAVDSTAQIFTDFFPNKSAVVIADVNTFPAAGKKVYDVLCAASVSVKEPFVFDQKYLSADYHAVEQLTQFLKTNQAVPIAVGSGTINDVVKLASYQCGRSYICVPTAASVDGYTAFGASISKDGFKQTFFCPAPPVIIADLTVLSHAPVVMNAAGYADLLAKNPAGADWILADALQIEPIDNLAWNYVQSSLPEWTANPHGIVQGDKSVLFKQVEGLMMSGLAMQRTNSSRPASGADHQFSHLWDDEKHTFNNKPVFHGFKVAVGSLASVALYDRLLNQTVPQLRSAFLNFKEQWPEFDIILAEIGNEFKDPTVLNMTIQQSREKYISKEDLEKRINTFIDNFPDIQKSLKQHLLTVEDYKKKLQIVQAPSHPEDIGISLARLHHSYRKAWMIRKRFTILDMVYQAGLWSDCVDGLFRPGGFWYFKN